MNTNNYMQYDNQKKSKTTAYLLGAISWIIPLGLHKWYLGHTDWAMVYILLFILSMLATGSLLLVFSLVYGILLLVDAFKTSIDVDNHNNKLIESLKEDDE